MKKRSNCFYFFVNHPLLDIILFTLILFWKTLFMFHLFKEANKNSYYINLEGQLLTIVTFLFVGFCFFLCKSRTRKITLLLLNLMISFLFFVDTLYYRYFSDLPSVYNLYNVNQVEDVKDTVIQLIQPIDFLFFLDIVIGMILLILFWRKMENTKIELSLAKRFFYFVFIITLLWTAISVSIGTVNSFFKNFESRNANSQLSAMIGTVNYHVGDIAVWLKHELKDYSVTEEEQGEIMNSFQKKESLSSSSLFGYMKGKSVIFVQMETFANFPVHLKIEGREVTPNFNKLIKTSYYADNFYSQIGDGHTSDAEWIVLNSLFPLKRGSVSVLYAGGDYVSLPQILQEKLGYTTFSAHGFRKEFWNRKNMHPSLGFQESHFADQFDTTEKIGIFFSDEEFFIQSVEKIKQLKEPYFAYLITLQNHLPFYVDHSDFDVGDLEGTLIGKYLKSVHEMDKALGVFIEELKENGLYDEVVLVLMGDHGAEFKEDMYQDLFKDVEEKDLYQFEKVPFLIHFPDESIVQTDSRPMGQLDVVPTVYTLLGVEEENTLFYGENIFSKNKKLFVCTMKDFCVGDDYVIMLDKTENRYKAYDQKTMKEIQLTKAMIENLQEELNKMEYSDLLIRTNTISEFANKQ